MTYQVVYTETLCGDYIIEADSEKEAEEIFENLLIDGHIDTLDLDVIDSSIEVEEVEE